VNPLRFFADHCVSNAIMHALRAIGAEVLRLREHLPTDAPDEVVITTAQQLEAILVSLNGDFANIVTYPPSRYRGIIALQVHNHPEIIPQLMERLTHYITSHPTMEEYAGKLFVVEVHRIRIRE
jgi:predicted nuclease of predicted toxin-antitoxin system